MIILYSKKTPLTKNCELLSGIKFLLYYTTYAGRKDFIKNLALEAGEPINPNSSVIVNGKTNSTKIIFLNVPKVEAASKDTKPKGSAN